MRRAAATRCAWRPQNRTRPNSSCPASQSGCSEPCSAHWTGSADGSPARAAAEEQKRLETAPSRSSPHSRSAGQPTRLTARLSSSRSLRRRPTGDRLGRTPGASTGRGHRDCSWSESGGAGADRTSPLAVGRRQRSWRSQPRTLTGDGLRRRRRSEVRVVNKLPANRWFLRGLSPRAAPRVPNGYPATQTHQPTVYTKKACKCRPFRERLKGFEPSTFCMASSRSAPPRMQKRLQIGVSGRLDRTLAFQELCADTGG